MESISILNQIVIQMPFVGVLVLALWKLQRELTRVQEARVQDANKVVEKVLSVVQSIDRNTAAVEQLYSRRGADSMTDRTRDPRRS